MEVLPDVIRLADVTDYVSRTFRRSPPTRA